MALLSRRTTAFGQTTFLPNNNRCCSSYSTTCRPWTLLQAARRRSSGAIEQSSSSPSSSSLFSSSNNRKSSSSGSSSSSSSSRTTTTATSRSNASSQRRSRKNVRQFASVAVETTTLTEEDDDASIILDATADNNENELNLQSLPSPSPSFSPTAPTDSSTTTTTTPDLLHPDQFGSIPYPTSLSPSSINEFKKCPQSFLFQYLYKLKQPTTTALAKGSMCHAALEQVFDLPPADRNLHVLQNLFRKEWAKHRLSDTYRFLFETNNDNDGDDDNDNDFGNDMNINNNNNNNNTEVSSLTEQQEQQQQQQQHHRDLQAEAEWGRSALQLLENYIQVEDPAAVTRPNPVQREVWVQANLSVQASAGVTGYTTCTSAAAAATTTTCNKNTTDNNQDTFLVRGIVDRLDMVRVVENHHGHHHHDNTNNNNVNKDERIVLRLIDYKTGKAPHLKYSRAMNEHIQSEAFYQLMIYALLLREQHAAKLSNNNNNNNNGQILLPLRFLRLFYLTSVDNAAVTMDLDLGDTQTKRDALLQAVHQDLSLVWQHIVELVSQQDPKAFVGCDRPFCYCHTCRARFMPGSVWEPDTHTHTLLPPRSG